jgi:exodeoxyribonuclease-1
MKLSSARMGVFVLPGNLRYTSGVNTFFFYDLETSGFDPKRQRIMQFAGQRTDMDMNPIGDPINVLVALSDEVLPDPAAVVLTGITPQKTLEEGYSEADFLKLLHEQVFTPGTIILGFNSVRFDDEFMRYTLYRNFYDPYEWAWQDMRSRWDMLDVVRMTRALRPDGIEWPFDENGQPQNRLEKLSAVNGLDHEQAHDALSDVVALIAVAKLIKTKQPQLFDYLLKMRDKKEVAKLVNLDDPKPFVYASGRYPKDFLHATVAFPIGPGSKPGSVLVYDLRSDPAQWVGKSVDDLKAIRFTKWEDRQKDGFVALPVKELAYNKCPAVAPLGVLDEAAQKRIKLDMPTVEKHLSTLRSAGIIDALRAVFVRDGAFPKAKDADAALYDGFVNDRDKPKMSAVRAADRQNLSDFDPGFADERLAALLIRYKARNYPQSLNQSEREGWEAYRAERIKSDLPRFSTELQRLSKEVSDEKSFLLSELHLWAESIVPFSE